jgi:hypothetical protein|tara:strand:- start:340 stop:549 length:210 start_codon:yes stop_codon:yes gene_type:complete
MTEKKSKVVYEVQDKLTNILVQVVTWPSITWKYRVILHDPDAGQQLSVYNSFKRLGDAKSYADKCVARL